MSLFQIRTFGEAADISCTSAAELRELLRALSQQFAKFPTLVNVYKGADKLAVIGLGSAKSTLQMVDLQEGTSVRALGTQDADADAQFSYQGEATFVPEEYLIPEDVAIDTVAQWLETGDLPADVVFRTREYPPSAAGTQWTGKGPTSHPDADG